MKKTFLLILSIALFSFCSLAGAEQRFYSNPQYSMQNLKTIRVVSIEDLSDDNDRSFINEKMIEDKVFGSLCNAANSKKLAIIDARDEAPELDSPNPYSPDTVDVSITVNRLGYKIERVEGYYRDETEYIRQSYVGKDGHTYYNEIPVTHQVYVPPYDRNHSYIDLSYNVMDANTGKMIANSLDERDRVDERDTSGMLKRSTANFLKLLQKAKKTA